MPYSNFELQALELVTQLVDEEEYKEVVAELESKAEPEGEEGWSGYVNPRKVMGCWATLGAGSEAGVNGHQRPASGRRNAAQCECGLTVCQGGDFSARQRGHPLSFHTKWEEVCH